MKKRPSGRFFYDTNRSYVVSQLAVLALRPIPVLPEIAHWLDQTQSERLAAISNPERELQFRAARYLAIKLLQQHAIEPHLTAQASGRPQAAHWPAADGLSWSHTQQWAAAALGLGRVGVDIETIRPRRNILAIAKQYFTDNEFTDLNALPPAEQLTRFFALWVAKEALLKALGTGIVGGLDRFELRLLDGAWQLNTSDRSCWQVQVWQLSADSICAVASDTPQTWQIDTAQSTLLLQAAN